MLYTHEVQINASPSIFRRKLKQPVCRVTGKQGTQEEQTLCGTNLARNAFRQIKCHCRWCTKQRPHKIAEGLMWHLHINPSIISRVLYKWTPFVILRRVNSFIGQIESASLCPLEQQKQKFTWILSVHCLFRTMMYDLGKRPGYFSVFVPSTPELHNWTAEVAWFDETSVLLI